MLRPKGYGFWASLVFFRVRFSLDLSWHWASCYDEISIFFRLSFVARTAHPNKYICVVPPGWGRRQCACGTVIHGEVYNFLFHFWGLMLCIQTLSRRQSCVSVSQCVSQYVWGREDMWQISESFYNLAGRLGSSNSKLFRRPLLLPACCCRCVLNCSHFLCVGKFWRAFYGKLAVFVQGKLCSISKLLCGAVYDLFFLTIFVCSLLFHSGVGEWSFLGVTGVVYSHKATYLDSPGV